MATTGSYRCCDPFWQLRAEPARHRFGQVAGGKEPGFYNFPAIGYRGIERITSHDMDGIGRAMQAFFGKFDQGRPLQGATGFLAQFAPGRDNRILARLQPAARRHPRFAAIGMAHQQHPALSIEGEHPAARQTRPAHKPPAPPHAVREAQGHAVGGGRDQVKHVTGWLAARSNRATGKSISPTAAASNKARFASPRMTNSKASLLIRAEMVKVRRS